MAGPDKAALVNEAILAKIDKLRELNVETVIPLPQLVVVGDQSSGKSSVLESLTGFSFPRAAGLCTRYATQIRCCRSEYEGVQISIIPRADANDELKGRLQKFQRQLIKLDNDALAKIFEEANATMGIRMNAEDKTPALDAFSQDILKIDINGPDQSHLTVIDVPGIFRVPTPGLTTENDVVLVRNMVKKYMENDRTIILAIMPCNVDIATQEILKLAEAADPNGLRTMGVMTKPDLATEKATQGAVIDLLLARRNTLKLGYHVVKNRGADDDESSITDRLAAEKAFLMSPPWSSAADRCGIPLLKIRLGDLLMQISKNEFPHVKREIEGRLRDCKEELEAIGPARSDATSQRLYLGKLASRFQVVTLAAMNGYYAGDKLFKEHPSLKLHDFGKAVSLEQEEGEAFFGDSETENTNPTPSPVAKHHAIWDILSEDEYECPEPSDSSPITQRIHKVHASSRGPELGTFGGTVLTHVFQEQTEKWVPLVLCHTSRAIVLVHDLVYTLVSVLCHEKEVREELWDGVLLPRLCDTYQRAMSHARFLLQIERDGSPLTLNHYFNANLQKKRSKRVHDSLKKHAVSIRDDYAPSKSGKSDYIPVSSLTPRAADKDNGQQIREDILDTLVSYYNVSRKRFVDVVCQQVVFHYLLEAEDGPLSILRPEMIMSLDEEQLEAIAGEDAESKRRRHALKREIKSLETAVKILRATV